MAGETSEFVIKTKATRLASQLKEYGILGEEP